MFGCGFLFPLSSSHLIVPVHLGGLDGASRTTLLFFFSHAVRAMTAPTVVQDCILFAHKSKDIKDLTRGESKPNTATKQKTQNTNTNQTNQKTKQPAKTIPKKRDHAGETVKHRELVPLNATLICSPQQRSPFHTSLSNFPKQFCTGCIIRFGHVFFRRFWI